MLLEPELEPLPIEPELGVLLEPLLELGELAEPLELGELDEPLEELLPELDGLAEEPLEDEPDWLKWASHSERDTWPSLFVSTEEKLGVELLELELGEVELDEPPADALPVEDDGDEDELPDLDESAAKASDEKAKTAAAVVRVTCLIMETPL